MKVPFLDLSRQNQPLRSELLAALADTLDNNRFALGKDVERFESALAAYCGSAGAVGVNNGTSALHLCAAALGIGPGDEVIVPPFTFIATAWTASYVGARLRFADIDRATFNLCPKALEAAITPRTKAVVVVHLFGLPADLDGVLDVARRHKLAVIEDCAQAIGARHNGRHVGTVGDYGTFSFYPTKNLGTCGEGGAVIAAEAARLEPIRLLRVHGMPKRYHHTAVGFNYRMEGFQGAVLGVKLPHLDAWIAGRRSVANRYLAGIRLSDTTLPVARPAWGESVWHQFTLRHPRRDALRAHLESCGVSSDLIYPIPLHLQECYADLGFTRGDFPVAEEAADTVLSLPIFPELTEAEVEHVIRSVNSF
jgi:dTDP-4-amino-4,6-dideoxygalactose transaminase